ncbi:MAG: hypothetical protein LBK06_07110 [Planctomycetaceae bacterium]|jgi:hypothetical protein|nr:hypothetical protein [Planctomycetaceae bacterium]
MLYAQAVLKFTKLNTVTQQQEAVAQGRSLLLIPATVYCLMFLFVGLLMIGDIGECLAKSRPVGFSTSHKHLDSKDWVLIKTKIERIFLYKNLQLAIENNSDTDDLVARIGEINWTTEQRKEISEYLLQTLTRIFTQKGFVDSIKNSKFTSPALVIDAKYSGDSVYEFIYAYRCVCDDLDTDKVNKLWEQNMEDTDFSTSFRSYLVGLLESQIKSEKSVDLARIWIKQLSSSKTDKELSQRLHKIIEYHEYAKIESEKEAWELFWERLKPADEEVFLTLSYSGKIGSALRDFINARTKYNFRTWCDPTITWEISQQSVSFPKRYYFLQFTIENFFSQCTYSSENIDESFREKLEKAVQQSSEIIKKNGYLKNKSYIDANEIILRNRFEVIERNVKQKINDKTPLESSPQPTTQSTTIYFLSSIILLILVIIVALIYRRKKIK